MPRLSTGKNLKLGEFLYFRGGQGYAADRNSTAMVIGKAATGEVFVQWVSVFHCVDGKHIGPTANGQLDGWYSPKRFRRTPWERPLNTAIKREGHTHDRNPDMIQPPMGEAPRE